MKSLNHDSDKVTRSGIERWENEGGLIRFSIEIPGGLRRRFDVASLAQDPSSCTGDVGERDWRSMQRSDNYKE